MSGDKFMLILQSDISESLISHAEAEYPRECCGILLGECDGGRKTVRRIIKTENAVGGEHSTAHFRIDPLAVAKAEQEPFGILGFYHSHPDCEAIPSADDILHMIAGHSYLIISVRNGECSDMRSFERISQISEEIKEEIILNNA